MRSWLALSAAPSTIEELARAVLNDEELAISRRFECLLTKGKVREAQSLLDHMLPKYWKDDSTSLFPVSVYRTIYYLDLASDYVDDTRHMIENMGQHLEGLVNQLVRKRGIPIKLGLGRKVDKLVPDLGRDLRSEIHNFSNLIHNVAKHPDDDPQLPVRFDVRRFSTHDTSLCLILVRHIAIELFGVLRRNGITLPESWPQLRMEWASWDEPSTVPPRILPRAERAPVPGSALGETEEDVA